MIAPPLSDTAPEAERVMLAVYRRMPPEWKMAIVDQARRIARQLHAAGLRLRQPGAADAEVNRDWAVMTLGPGPWLDRMRFDHMLPSGESLRPVKHVVQVLDDLNIRYAIGGSVASSIHGPARYTQDVDFNVESFPGKEQQFVLRFPPAEYYADISMIRDAMARRSCFNVIHLASGLKIDLFVQKDRPFTRELLGRRVMTPLFGEGEGEFGVVTAEDTILLKLEWYRLGGEISERQWTDVLGVMKTQSDRLDSKYLRRWADELGVTDLLDRANLQIVPV